MKTPQLYVVTHSPKTKFRAALVTLAKFVNAETAKQALVKANFKSHAEYSAPRAIPLDLYIDADVELRI